RAKQRPQAPLAQSEAEQTLTVAVLEAVQAELSRVAKDAARLQQRAGQSGPRVTSVDAALAPQLVLSPPCGLEGGLRLPQRRLERDVVVGAEDSPAPKNPSNLCKHALRLHPRQRLRGRHEIRRRVRESRLVRRCVPVANVLRRRRRGLGERPHRVVGFDPYHLVGEACPDAGRQAASASEVDDAPQAALLHERRHQLEKRSGRSRTESVVDGRETGLAVARLLQQATQFRVHAPNLLWATRAPCRRPRPPRHQATTAVAHAAADAPLADAVEEADRRDIKLRLSSPPREHGNYLSRRGGDEVAPELPMLVRIVKEVVQRVRHRYIL